MNKDYSLTGPEAVRAVENGLADAKWYSTPIPRAEMRKLLSRHDATALRDTFIWLSGLAVSGAAIALLWGSWWALLPIFIYSTLYASPADSRWHESSHGTAFKTDWMNNVLYEVASFMVFRESTPWRWSHARHHSDTIVVGRDPEIGAPRPPNVKKMFLGLFIGGGVWAEWKKMLIHCTGRLTDTEKTYVPESQYRRTIITARIYLLIYASAIGACFYFKSILPLIYIGLPSVYGMWLGYIFGNTQHAGLAENVLDHRLNCRTVYMNRFCRFMYWNMNYHVEHHMFPLVPFHALPRLHELMKADCPTPYPSLRAAYREIIPTLLRQAKDPSFFIKRELPTPSIVTEEHHAHIIVRSASDRDPDGWIEVCPSDALETEDVIRLDCDDQTFAIYRNADGGLHATDGICTHGNAHLADGLVKGNLIECSKHNGRFDMRDGSAQRAPVCAGIRTYTVEERNGTLFLNLNSAGGCGAELEKQTHRFSVVSNSNVATFIKELVLEPIEGSPAYQPGEYLQFNIPTYQLTFDQLSIDEPFSKVWKNQRLFECKAENELQVRRNYSMASNPATESQLRFNIRIATPPPGVPCHAGTGSSYMFNLKPGDSVSAIGPFGDFHIKPTDNEMVYIGGGAGMAPLRAHLSHLLETQKSKRKISFWYGARSKQELFYADFFQTLEKAHPNFSFHVALSEPEASDDWNSHTGFIHEIVKTEYLAKHDHPQGIEFYLCGPPAMIQATAQMLKKLNVPAQQIAFDEF